MSAVFVGRHSVNMEWRRTVHAARQKERRVGAAPARGDEVGVSKVSRGRDKDCDAVSHALIVPVDDLRDPSLLHPGASDRTRHHVVELLPKH